jgi:hypothetical protein
MKDTLYLITALALLSSTVGWFWVTLDSVYYADYPGSGSSGCTTGDPVQLIDVWKL